MKKLRQSAGVGRLGYFIVRGPLRRGGLSKYLPMANPPTGLSKERLSLRTSTWMTSVPKAQLAIARRPGTGSAAYEVDSA